MRKLTLTAPLLVLLLSGCSNEDVVKWTMTKTMQLGAEELCDGEQACMNAVEEQMEGCVDRSPSVQQMVAGDFEEPTDEESLQLAVEIYGCIVDEDGNSYFAFDQQQGDFAEAVEQQPLRH